MGRTLALFLMGIFWAAGAAAQAPGAAPAAQAVAVIAPGTTFNAVLVGSVDSQRLKPGDAVFARITEAVVSGGAVALPKNTRLAGHITFATAKAKGDAESALALQFDKAVLKNGAEVPLNALLQALAPPLDSDLATAGDAGFSAASSSAAGGNAGAGTSTFVPGGAGLNKPINAAVNAANQGAAAPDAPANSASPAAPAATAAATLRGVRPTRGLLPPDSQGVLQFRGFTLAPAPSGAPGPVLTSAGPVVRLDSGTRLLLAVPTPATALPKP